MWPVDDIFVPPVVITSLCRDTISARTVVGHSLLLARLPGTHWVTICAIWRLARTVSDVHSRLVCFQSTSTPSALEVLHSMRYINLRLTYLLTKVYIKQGLSIKWWKAINIMHSHIEVGLFRALYNSCNYRAYVVGIKLTCYNNK